MRQLILILLFFYSASVSYAQTDSLFALAQKAKDETNYKEALQYYLKIVRQAEKGKDANTLARAYTAIADIYEDGYVYEKALEYLDKVHEIAPTQSISLKKAEIFMRAGKNQNALDIYKGLLKEKEYSLATTKSTYSRLNILRKIVVILQRLEDYESCLDNNLQILEIQQGLKDTEGTLIAINNVGYAYKQLKKYPQAIKSFQEVLAIETKEGGKFASNPTSRINLGVSYQNIGDYATALDYLDGANKMIEATNNKREMAKMYELLSATYLAKKDYYNARIYSDLARQLAVESKDAAVLQRVYETSSLLYQAEEQYDKALVDYKKHLAIRDSLFVEERARQNDLSQAQIVIERTEKEIKLLAAEDEVKAEIIKTLKEQDARKEKELELAESNAKRNEALLSQKELEQVRNKQELLLLQNQAEADKKDRTLLIFKDREKVAQLEIERKSAQEKASIARIAGLEKDKKLTELESRDREKKSADKDAEDKRFRYTVMAVIAIGGLIFLLVFIGLLITRKKNKQLAYQQEVIKETNAELVQTNEEIAAQRDVAENLNQQIGEKNAELLQTNEEMAAQRDHAESLSKVIGEKNESIMASIMYAQRIQQAILIAPEIIAHDLPDHFILFQPRDIVSGDFYFFANTKGVLILAAVDCTGHGVPGAFMSMIGHEVLEDITIMRQITCPETILNELHKGIRKALKQEQTNNRDGMDLSIVCIDKTRKIVEFAGAKNPLVYIQNGEVHTLKGDKMPVGGEQREAERNFRKHQISIETPTFLYLFSDGYQDQFGGAENKKFSVARMKNLFLEIYQEPVEKQHKTLQTTINQWMQVGKEYQIDDILVIGVGV